ncbi:phosphatidylglycerophosphatase A [Celeribacter indicus]|uniref:Phosphatidylglycerophosphatase A n=1 Tax=Celeribacter indicus TaxID=1208324 RepID=A0A0B5E1N6_9RHOB|nr:phosphatidylglycerophosphatase A [Celeribacter indicus]AJE46956.1 phosphatidylglycerophosphatase [Celeribacter indicus]SDW77694.1 phosphatidylglycerophosphatase A [Celeribacter indicus]
MRQLAEFVATLARVGYLTPASGTWGSAAAVALFWAIHEIAGPLGVLVALVAVFLGGIWAVGTLTAGAADHDPSFIVIDEVAGQWIALLPVTLGAAAMGVPSSALWPGYLTGFLAFRLFDIWKPWIIGRADRRNDAFGVMLDDALAGVFAAVVVLLAAGIAHGVMMR